MPIPRKAWYSILVLSMLIALLYAPGLNGAFNFDDDGNITSNKLLQIYELDLQSLAKAAGSGYAGPTGRPLPMLSFALDHMLSQGFSPQAMKVTNLLIHISCGIALYVLSHLLISRALSTGLLRSEHPVVVATWAPVVTAFLWLAHPVNLTPALYVVQRMTSMSAFFCVLGMICYVHGRTRLEERGTGYAYIAAAYLACLPLAVLSKENGALLPIYLLLIEMVFFRGDRNRGQHLAPPHRQNLTAIHFFIGVLPIIVFTLFLAFNPDFILNAYHIRDFTLWERVMTESRVIFLYLRLTLKPLISEMALFHDYFPISRGLLSPMSTLAACAGLVVMATGALLLRQKQPLLAFGVAFFLLAHSIESTLLGLELIHEHRNYLASWALLLIPTCYLFTLWREPRTRALVCCIILACGLILSFQTWQRATIWGNQLLHAMDEVENHPDSPRSNYQAGRVYAFLAYAEQDPQQKLQYIDQVQTFFRRSAAMERNNTDAMFGLLMLSAIEGVELTDAEFQSFLRRFERKPFPPNSYNYLQAMFSCLNDGACKISHQRVADIIAASATNPGFGGKPAELVLAAYQRYLLDHEMAGHLNSG